MKATTTKAIGRPKVKSSRRNFKFAAQADSFLTAEASRTGKNMTTIIEQSLIYMASLKPATRDALISNSRAA